MYFYCQLAFWSMEGLCESLKERSLSDWECNDRCDGLDVPEVWPGSAGIHNAKVSNSDLFVWLNRFPADDTADEMASPALTFDLGETPQEHLSSQHRKE